MTIDLAIAKLITDLRLGQKSKDVFSANEAQITIPKERLLSAVEIFLGAGIWHLSTITCQEWGERFILFYHFWKNKGVSLKILLEKENASIESICRLIPGAEFYEREILEMFGVVFEGLPNPAPLLLPDNWKEAPPMRKVDPSSSPEGKPEKKDLEKG